MTPEAITALSTGLVALLAAIAKLIVVLRSKASADAP